MNVARLLGENVQKFGEYEQFIHVGADGEVVLTNVEIENRARALATGLKRLGVTKGDIVGVILGNVPEIPQTINGIVRLAAVFMPIIFALTPPEIRHILEDSKAKVIITEEKLWPKVKEAAQEVDSVKTVIIIGNVEGSNIVQYNDLLKEADERGDVEEVSNDDLAILMYTAGTTGFSKGVMLSHDNLESNMRQGAEVWPFDHSTRILITMPMSHSYGMTSYHEGCAFGCTTVLLPRFDPVQVLDVIRDYEITVIGLVPTMITMLTEVYDPGKHSMKSMKLMVSSGAPLPEETLERAVEMLGIQIYNAYGLTEAGPTVARQRKDRPLKYGSVGPPLPGVELKLVDDDGNEVPQGKEGEIICKGPGIMKGYWNKPELTAAVLKDGWLYTGDLGRLDEERDLQITGRKKDLIIKGGENIDPGVSEKWLYKHPAILEAAVVAIPDDKYGEDVAAVVVLKPGQEVSEEELINYVREHVHHFSAPRKVFIVDGLPKTTTGKILKREIKRKIV